MLLQGARALAWAAALLVAAAVAGADDVKIDSETFGGLRARSIGPAAMSGRITALDAVEGDRLTVFVGSAGGGVWKSRDGGTTFKPVFDKHPQSIGAVAIDRSNPDVVWVGTGEAWTRNSVSVGEGIYKTSDGGDNWERVGLAESERIARIAIDPLHPDTVFVAVVGHLWNAHPMRGVYRTHDGGTTWERVLFVNENTGGGAPAREAREPVRSGERLRGPADPIPALLPEGARPAARRSPQFVRDAGRQGAGVAQRRALGTEARAGEGTDPGRVGQETNRGVGGSLRYFLPACCANRPCV
jgi:hypothetical protein